MHRSAPLGWVRNFTLRAVFASFLMPLAYAAEIDLTNSELLIRISSGDGSYTIGMKGTTAPALRARIAAEVDHHWINSTDYPKHEISESSFEDALGRGHQAMVTSTGLSDRPDLSYTIRVYDNQPFGDVQVHVQNHSARAFEVQSIRSLEAVGEQIRQSKESIFFGALTSDLLLTIFHLKAQPGSDGPTITGFTVDATGTTEIQATDEESGLREGPQDNLIKLSLPLPSGGSMASERLMFAAGSDYHAQLENYGAAIRELHHSRIAEGNLLGWWSWTALYMKITEGNTFTNALWLAEHLKPLGYDLFHVDYGYAYARESMSDTRTGWFITLKAILFRSPPMKRSVQSECSS